MDDAERDRKQLDHVLFGSLYDNAVKGTRTASWSRLVGALRRLQTPVEKDRIGHILMGRFLPPEEAVDFVNDGRGVPQVRRVGANLHSMSALVLDYDGGRTMATARADLRPWEHVGATSWSHRTLRKQGRDCFRVYLPLVVPMPAEELRLRRPGLLDLLPGLDRETFALGRVFRLHSCEAARAALATSWHNRGDWFDWRDVPRSAPPEPPPAAMATGVPPDNDERAKIVQGLASSAVRYEPTWWKCCLAMAAEGFDFADFWAATSGGMMTDKSYAEAVRRWERALAVAAQTPYRMGYLYNVAFKGMHRRD